MTRLSKTEKDEIARLYKCQRAALELEIYEIIDNKAGIIVEEINKEISVLKIELETKEGLKQEMLNEAGYKTYDRKGCLKAHPEIDTFKAETAAQLMKLWSGEVNKL